MKTKAAEGRTKEANERSINVHQYGGGSGVYKKPQNRTKNTRKPQNRSKFRSNPKTASKIKEDVHAIEVVEEHIFPTVTEKTPNRIE